MPDGFAVKKLKYAATKSTDKLDDVSALMVKAWKGLQAKQRAASKKAVEQAIPWDAEGFQHPKNPDNDEELRKDFDELKKTLKITETSTSATMTGSIALGLIIVKGTASGLGFSDAETRLVLQEVVEGCQFLASAYPRAKVTFVYVIHVLTISAAPNDSCDSSESCESVFRDPALAQLGYAAGDKGCIALVEDLKKNNKTQWGYVAFITKYPLIHFAYASGVKICMQYANDGWGPNQINRVFAHETCHIFGAADEYADSRCTCAKKGNNNVPNYNCVNCTDSLFDHVPCLMNQNTLSLCSWTMGQLGWINPAVDSSPVYVGYDSQQHGLYVDKNNTISDILYAGGKWQYQNLHSAVVEAPLAQGNPFSLVYFSQHHTLYWTKNNLIWDILWDGSNWQYVNLHKERPEAPVAQGNPFGLIYYKQLHTLYLDVNNTISDILYNSDGRNWVYQNLNKERPDAPKAKGNPFSVEYYSQHHTLYRDENKTISDILYAGSWQYQNLHTSAPGAPLAQGDPFSLVNYTQHHTLYRDVDKNISDIWYDHNTGKWRQVTLQTQVTGAALAAGDPFSLIYNSDQHNLYRDVDNKISDIYYDGSKWHPQNLHKERPEAPVAQGNPFSMVYNSEFHTLYWDVNNNLSDIYYDGSKWHYYTWIV